MIIMSVQAKSREEILAHLREVLVDLFEIKPEQVVPEANLYTDLDIDSIDAVDLILKLKDFTGRKIQPQAFKHVRTVNDVVDAIHALMNEAPVA
jgi:acyl carrier protein